MPATQRAYQAAVGGQRWKEAEKAYHRVVKDRPKDDHWQMVWRLHFEWAKSRSIDGIRAAAGMAYKQFPHSPIPLYYLALAEFRASNRAGALSYLDQAAVQAKQTVLFRADPRFVAARKALRDGKPDPFVAGLIPIPFSSPEEYSPVRVRGTFLLPFGVLTGERHFW